MKIEKIINAFVSLTNYEQQFFNSDNERTNEMGKAIALTLASNSWFKEENIRNAISSIFSKLTKTNLLLFLSAYSNEEDGKMLMKQSRSSGTKRVGVIMAGNIPLVGFYDFMFVLLSGNIFVGKLSSQDKYLLPAIASLLIE